MMTNATLGDLVGLSPSGASRLRNGNRRPSWSTLNRVAFAFGWPAPLQFEIWNKKGGEAYSRALALQIRKYEARTQDAPAAAVG